MLREMYIFRPEMQHGLYYRLPYTTKSPCLAVSGGIDPDKLILNSCVVTAAILLTLIIIFEKVNPA